MDKNNFLPLYEKSLYCNYFPIINSKKYKLHLEIFAARCGYFKAIMDNKDKLKTNDEIKIEGINDKIIKQCLKDIYSMKISCENYKNAIQKIIVFKYLLCDKLVEKYKKFILDIIYDDEDLNERHKNFIGVWYSKNVFKNIANNAKNHNMYDYLVTEIKKEENYKRYVKYVKYGLNITVINSFINGDYLLQKCEFDEEDGEYDREYEKSDLNPEIEAWICLHNLLRDVTLSYMQKNWFKYVKDKYIEFYELCYE